MFVVRRRSPLIAERRGAGPDQRRNIEQGGPMSDPRSLPAEERARLYWAENQRLIITLSDLRLRRSPFIRRDDDWSIGRGNGC